MDREPIPGLFEGEIAVGPRGASCLVYIDFDVGPLCMWCSGLNLFVCLVPASLSFYNKFCYARNFCTQPQHLV